MRQGKTGQPRERGRREWRQCYGREPDCELDAERALLFQILTATAAGELVPPPVAIDAGQLIYRTDLRDYGWDGFTRIWPSLPSEARQTRATTSLIGHAPLAEPPSGADRAGS